MADRFISAQGIAFRVFGFPVLYRWSALLLPALFGLPVLGSFQGIRAVEAFLVLALAIGAAVLVHELGHAVTSRAFGGVARIELVFLGGLTYHHYREPLSNGRRALVSVAGSVFGAVAAGVVALIFTEAVTSPSTIWESGIRFFVYAGAVWGIFNLVPLPGLDGSHILDAGVRTIAPKAAPVVVPVVTAVFAVVAIVGMYLFAGLFGAVWLLIIFGPELVALPQRIRHGRDEPLTDRAIEAERAFRRGELEHAAMLSSEVLEVAGSSELREPMVRVNRASLWKLGRHTELLALDGVPGVSPMPPLMRARALAGVGRLAEAESEARSVIDRPEAAALVVELLVKQDLDERAGQLVDDGSAMAVCRRIAELEPVDPVTARRLAQVVVDASNAPAHAIELARMSLGEPPRSSGLEPRSRWLIEAEWSARSGDTPEFERAVRQIPDAGVAQAAQERLHLIGRYDQAARIGSVAGSDAGAQYLLARSFARLGRTEPAVQALAHAVSAGWTDAAETVTEPDLLPLHSHPQWGHLLVRMADTSAERSRA